MQPCMILKFQGRLGFVVQTTLAEKELQIFQLCGLELKNTQSKLTLFFILLLSTWNTRGLHPFTVVTQFHLDSVLLCLTLVQLPRF